MSDDSVNHDAATSSKELEEEARVKKLESNLIRSHMPYHTIGCMLEPASIRIRLAEQALARGHDVNQLDIWNSYNRNLGRPLHQAVEAKLPVFLDEATNRVVWEDLEWLKWLLDHGADPRLNDVSGQKSAIDETQHYIGLEKSRGSTKTYDPTSVIHYYDESLNLMKSAASKIEAKERAEKGVAYRVKSLFGYKEEPPELECVRRYNWCYYCLKGTLVEYRTPEKRDNLIRLYGT